MSYLFTIFHRLNSGGVRLNNQEIRNCIYTGQFNDMLKDFDNRDIDWQVVKSRLWGSVSRFRSVEVLLRVLAFTEFLDQYDGNLAGFLNRYMHARADITAVEAKKVYESLHRVTRISRAALGDESSGKISLAIIEAVLVGTMNNKETLEKKDSAELRVCYYSMLKMPAFAEGARYAMSSKENVQARLHQAVAAFAV